VRRTGTKGSDARRPRGGRAVGIGGQAFGQFGGQIRIPWREATHPWVRIGGEPAEGLRWERERVGRTPGRLLVRPEVAVDAFGRGQVDQVLWAWVVMVVRTPLSSSCSSRATFSAGSDWQRAAERRKQIYGEDTYGNGSAVTQSSRRDRSSATAM
jgi:hypothetical protein